ncbi:MAG: hypothetical protein NWE89_08520 [Candidatus Bathyarchaeota archaeon]|nr:hypothetical protein [Candidatus Bathyarchaeota archaeon]
MKENSGNQTTRSTYTYLNGGDIPTFIDSYEKLLNYYDEYDHLTPSHNELCVEKSLLKEVYKAVVDIAEGNTLKEQTEKLLSENTTTAGSAC